MDSIQLQPRVLKNLNGRNDLTCSCGAVPSLEQPNMELPDALLGVCAECDSWTVFLETSPDWRAAHAFGVVNLRNRTTLPFVSRIDTNVCVVPRGRLEATALRGELWE
jgi:hypothetical protein